MRAAVLLALIVPMYMFPAVCWLLLPGNRYSLMVMIARDVLAGFTVGFLANNYRLGVLVLLACAGVDLGIARFSNGALALLLVAGVIPALSATYFTQRLLTNMGD